MKLDTTLMQWFNTKPNAPDTFLIFANQYAWMKVRKETDYCYSVYYDAEYSEKVHQHLDTAFDMFCMEAAE
jgi:hypothetical protein